MNSYTVDIYSRTWGHCCEPGTATVDDSLRV